MLQRLIQRIEYRLDDLGLSATAASQRAGLGTDGIRNIYRAIKDRKPRGISTLTIEALAPALETSVEWLLGATENGAPPRRSIPIHGTVGAGMHVSIIGDTVDIQSVDSYEMPDDGEIAGLIVKGDSGYPRFIDGEVVLYDPRNVDPAGLIGKYAIVQTLDGERMIKRLQRGRKPGTFLLKSHNADDVDNVELLGVWRFIGILAN